MQFLSEYQDKYGYDAGEHIFAMRHQSHDERYQTLRDLAAAGVHPQVHKVIHDWVKFEMDKDMQSRYPEKPKEPRLGYHHILVEFTVTAENEADARERVSNVLPYNPDGDPRHTVESWAHVKIKQPGARYPRATVETVGDVL